MLEAVTVVGHVGVEVVGGQRRPNSQSIPVHGSDWKPFSTTCASRRTSQAVISGGGR